MAEITSVINVVAWGTRLSLSLYDFGIANAAATRQANKIAKSVSMLTLMLKQVGTLLKEDNTTPSDEAVDTVRDIVLHTNNAFAAIEALIPVNPHLEAAAVDSDVPPAQRRKWDLVSTDNLQYLLTYVDTLNSTLSVMLQALYTVRVIAWSRSRQDRLPASAADAVANECSQLDVLIVEQQLLLLELSDAYASYRRSCDFSDSPSSSVHFEQKDFVPNQDKTPPPTSLDRYRDPSLSDVQPSRPLTEISSLVRKFSPSFSNHILSRWTLLQEIEQRLAVPEDEIYKPLTPSQPRFGPPGRRTSYEVDHRDGPIPGIMRTGTGQVESPKPTRPPVSPIGAMEHGGTRPIPITPLPTARAGQVFSPGSSNSLPAGYSVQPGRPPSMAPSMGYSPASPRTGFSNYYQPQPQARPTAVADNRPSTEVMLGIPWRLWLQSYHWDFTDDKVMNTNSQVPLDKAYTDRNGWTELMQTWVRREAIEEARLSFNQVQKEVQDVGRTRFETCFCIGKPLTYAEVRRLVDRSIEIYRATQYPPSLATTESAGTGPATPSVSLPILNDSKQQRRGHSRHNSYYSTDPSSDDDYSDDGRTTSRHHRRHGTGSRESSRHWDKERKEEKRRRKESKGSSTFGTLARYGGIATLLEGLPEILKGL